MTGHSRLANLKVLVLVLFVSFATELFHLERASAGEPASQKPLKVFVLAGQSNMQGHAQVSTFDAMRLNPAAAPLLEKTLDASGRARVCERVWISSIGSAEEVQTGRLTTGFGAQGRSPKIGPEFTFGIYVEELLDEPVLIIKTAWGGKSLNTDFRPPGAEPYEFDELQLEQFAKQGKDLESVKAEKAEATGRYYRMMIDHVQSVLSDIKSVYPEYEPQHGYELAGFVWFQGWNDMVDRGTYPNRDQPGGYDQYSDLLAQFIRDVRSDLASPDLRFVIGVFGVGGPTDQYGPAQQRYQSVHQNFRDAMAAPANLPEFQGSVVTVLTENFWDMEVTRLRDREASLRPEIEKISAAAKAGEITNEQRTAAVDKLYANHFDKRELEILKSSVSNAEYHYLGSAGIMTQIGKAFAEAVVK